MYQTLELGLMFRNEGGEFRGGQLGGLVRVYTQL